MQPVLGHCLAILLFHEAFLLHDLGQGNPLRFIPLCTHPLQEPKHVGLTRLPAIPLHIPTNISVKAAFVSYSAGQTPWKRLTNAMVDKTDRVLLADFKFLMEHIERELVQKNAWNGEVPNDPSYATRLFDPAKDHVPMKTKHGRTLMRRTTCLYLWKQCKARVQEHKDGTIRRSCYHVLRLNFFRPYGVVDDLFTKRRDAN